ncbi:hypothetical protein PAE975_6099 (plasmid) [Pseudomonas aeruginosa]|uniref:GIN domain-containing protein n=1 Tax=Pseudomonas aeruginosa TaxID=287 RepID=UPI001A2AB9E5|nr:DUF2807 domain-containing protein [Pseudomonas aeruginosa]MBH8699205.1 DUF2807 domain-containing protein [Pseudomonas aeruginosa]HEK3608634.1 DUF2807 domain-containing protein [Pseudomonas aeruginosa]
MSNPLLSGSAHEKDSAWKQAEGYEKEERPMRSVRKIVVKGSVDLVFFRAPNAHLVVAGENQDAIRSVQTRFDGDKLVIEQQGVSINVSGSGNVVITGSGGRFSIGGKGNSISVGSLHAMVGIALPEAPSIRIKGSSDVTLYDLRQPELNLGIQGSGDIEAFGQVDHIDVQVDGSGDVDVSELVAVSAELSISGSGDIDAHVTRSVKARVAGSGDIVVRGNPPIRDHSVAGSGHIKFK